MPEILEDALIYQSFGDNYGKKEIRNAITVLRILWEAIGSAEVIKWLRGSIVFFQPEEILQLEMYGKSEFKREIGENDIQSKNIKAKSKKIGRSSRVSGLQENRLYGSTPHRFQPIEQLKKQFSEIMQKVPYEEAQTTIILYCLRKASQGKRIVQQPLSAVFESGEAGERIARDAGNRAKAAGFNGWRSITGTIEYEEDRAPCMQATKPPNVVALDGYNQTVSDTVQCLRSERADADHQGIVMVLNDQGGSAINIEKGCISPTLKSQSKGHESLVFDARGNGSGKTSPTMVGDHNGRLSDYTAIALDCRNLAINEELSAPLQAKPNGGQSLNYINPIAAFRYKSFGEYEQDDKSKALLESDDITTGDLIASNYRVRRLTPLECERLQGLPDYWTEYGYDGKKISDSARYKALGNGMAEPCVYFVLLRIKESDEAGGIEPDWFSGAEGAQ